MNQQPTLNLCGADFLSALHIASCLAKIRYSKVFRYAIQHSWSISALCRAYLAKVSEVLTLVCNNEEGRQTVTQSAG